MSYAPQSLLDARAYVQDQTGLPLVALGIVGDRQHTSGYHLGADRLPTGDYSARTSRDRAGLSDAASALDIGSHRQLVELTAYLVAEARAGRARDIREIIGPGGDGRAYRWAAENGWRAERRADGDSHEWHLHVSYYRDSEHRDKIDLFRGFYEEDDMPSAEEIAKAVWRYEDPVLDQDYGRLVRWLNNGVRPDRAQTPGVRIGITAELDQVAARVEAILAAVSGGDVATAVRAELDRHRELAAQERQAEHAELAELVRQAQAGEVAAAEVVRLIGERLSAAADESA